MGRSLALAINLILSAGGRSDGLSRPARPEGRVIWIHLSPGAPSAPIGQLATRIARDTKAARIVITAEDGPPDPTTFPPGTISEALAARRTGAVAGALSHWQPDLVILTGSDLPPALIVGAHDNRIPVVLIDLRIRKRDLASLRVKRGMLLSLLGRIDRILVRDHDSAERLIRLAGTDAAPVVAGPIEETADPLTCLESERDALSQLIGTRPVWLAAGVTEPEEEAVIAAHAHAMRLAHRMLLILVPADRTRGAALAERLGREGWVVGLRSHDHEPDPETQVLIDDADGEYGLWYRLAPVTFMGGTLTSGSTRSPMEPAALGSAILAGPAAGAFARAYTRLSAAGAFSSLRALADLSDRIGEVIAPDRAATLAHNAWAASSSGVEAADRISGVVAALLSARTASAGKVAEVSQPTTATSTGAAA